MRRVCPAPIIHETHATRSGNRDGLHQLLSHNISATRPSITLALAVCLAGHLIPRKHHQHVFQFTACAMILLRNTGGGGDVGAASINLADLRSACIKENTGQMQIHRDAAAEVQSDWSYPGSAEWARALDDIETSFTQRQKEGVTGALSVGIIELAMVVRASKFIHTIMAPPPPAATFINFTVNSQLAAAAAAAIALISYPR